MAMGTSREKSTSQGPASRPIRVLFVSDHLGYKGGAAHGITTYFQSVLSRLPSATITGSACIFKDYHPAALQLASAGVNTIFLERAKWDPRALLDLTGVIRSYQIDVLHLHSMKVYLLGRIASAITGTPAILHFHDTNTPDALIAFLQRLMVPWTTRAIAVSPHVEETVTATYGIPEDRIVHLPYGVDLSRFLLVDRSVSALRDYFDIPHGVPVVGVIGRMFEGKGQRRFLEHVPSLVRQVPHARVLFVGEGPTRPECESLARRLNVESHTHFTGNRDDIPSVLAEVDVVVSPSTLDEGFGLVLLEGMAAGKPVVGFDVGAASLLLDGKNAGRVIERGDYESFAQALSELLMDRTMRQNMGIAARDRALDFSLSRHVDQLCSIYDQVLHSKKIKPTRQ